MPNSLICLLDADAMTTEEYSLWRDELSGQQDGDCFFNTLRRHLAKRFSIAHWSRFPFLVVVYSHVVLSFISIATNQVKIALAKF